MSCPHPSSIPPEGPPRDSFPLPLELTKLIFEQVYLPSRKDIPRKYYKFNGPRYSLNDVSSIKSLRSVCRTFADAGAPFLVDRICIASEKESLDRLIELHENPNIAKGLRTLVYDAASYGWCKAWLDSQYVKQSREHGDDWDCCDYCSLVKDNVEQVSDNESWFKDMALERELIREEGQDTKLLMKALPTLNGLSKVIFWSYVQDWRWKPNVCGPMLPSREDYFSYLPIGFVDGNVDSNDFRPLFNLATALTSIPNNIQTLELHVHISFLAAAQRVPARFETLCEAFTRIRDLKLALSTDSLAAEYHTGTIHAAYPDSTELRALLATGALGKLIGSATNLRRLKLNLSENGARRDRTGVWTSYELPLTAYIGSGATRWPDLQYLYLGSMDLTSTELCDFIVAHPRITELDLDQITLREGTWAPVSVLAYNLLDWRKVKQHHLRQRDPRREFGGLERRYEEVLGMRFEEYEWDKEQFVWWEEQSSTACSGVDETEA